MMENRNTHGLAELAELSFGLRPAEELYDLANDPEQMNNLAGAASYAQVQAEMRKRLFDRLTETKDPRVVGGTVGWDFLSLLRHNSDRRMDGGRETMMRYLTRYLVLACLMSPWGWGADQEVIASQRALHCGGRSE